MFAVLKQKLAWLIEDCEYVPPANETPAMRSMREWMLVLPLCLPWLLTPFIIDGAIRDSGPPRVLIEQLKRFPPLTAKQITDYCIRQSKDWTLPWWRDPACAKPE